MSETHERCEVSEDSVKVVQPRRNDSVLLENIGGVILLSVSGLEPSNVFREDGPEEERVERRVLTSISTDAVLQDIVPWMRRVTEQEQPADTSILASEVYRVIDLQDVYNNERNKIHELSIFLRESGKSSSLEAERTRVAMDVMLGKIAEHSIDVVRNDKKIADETIAGMAVAVAEFEGNLASLLSEIKDRTDALNEGIGQELEEYKKDGPLVVRKLMKPIRNLLAEGLLEPGDSFEGVFERAVSFTRMGKVISVAVASSMNTDQIPLSFQDGLNLASSLEEMAKMRSSIWG